MADNPIRDPRAVAISLSLCAIAFVAAPRGSPAAVVPVELTARVAVVRVAPGVKFRAWTFNGSVPGPVVRARAARLEPRL